VEILLKFHPKLARKYCIGALRNEYFVIFQFADL